MGIIGAYAVLALLFLALSVGIFKPKKWHDLTDKHVKILKIGCFFCFLAVVANIVAKLV